jgi:molecular chaperone GrpE (heat shock protein)
LKEFENEIKEGNIDKETAKKYVKIMNQFSDRVKDHLKDSGLDGFVKEMAKLEDSIEDAAKDAPKEIKKTLEGLEADTNKLKNVLTPNFSNASDFSQEVDNVINGWLKIQNK